MDCTLHLIDEKQYREIYVPAVAGDEAALNQLLEWASLLSAGWESRSEAYRLVKELRGKWKSAVEAKSGGTPAPSPSGYGYGSPAPSQSDAGRTIDFAKNLNYVYGVLSAFRRPAFYARDFSFSTLTKAGLGDLASFVVDARMLIEGIPGVPPWMPATATGGLGQGATSGLYLPKDRVVPFLKALRANLRTFGDKIRATGHDPEEGLAWLISACVEAKEIRPECGILELQDAYSPHGGRGGFPAETARALATNTFPRAVLKEVRKALGTLAQHEEPPEEAPKPAPRAKADPSASEPPVAYSPAIDYRVGQRVTHKRFGTGEVKKIINRNKVVVAFGGEERTLAQNSSGTPSEPRIPVPMAPEGAPTPPPPPGGDAPLGAETPPPASPPPPPHHPLPPTPGPRFQESRSE